MNEKQRRRCEIITRLLANKISSSEASKLLGLSSRQVRRIRQRYEAHGLETLVHGNQGRPSSRRTQPALIEQPRELAGPVVATAVANIPQISYRQGARFLAALLGASAIMLALGKALDLKAALANLAVCVAIVVAVYLNAPPGSSSSEKFEHDVKTDVKLKISLQTVTGQPKESDVGYSCFAILPDTWFRTRPLLYLTLATTSRKRMRTMW